MCEYFVCIQSQSYNSGDPDKCSKEDCSNCLCDYPSEYGCLICGNYDEYDMVCLKNKTGISFDDIEIRNIEYEELMQIVKENNI